LISGTYTYATNLRCRWMDYSFEYLKEAFYMPGYNFFYELIDRAFQGEFDSMPITGKGMYSYFSTSMLDPISSLTGLNCSILL